MGRPQRAQSALSCVKTSQHEKLSRHQTPSLLSPAEEQSSLLSVPDTPPQSRPDRCLVILEQVWGSASTALVPPCVTRGEPSEGGWQTDHGKPLPTNYKHCSSAADDSRQNYHGARDTRPLHTGEDFGVILSADDCEVDITDWTQQSHPGAGTSPGPATSPGGS